MIELSETELQALRITLKEYVDLRIRFMEQNIVTANAAMNIRLEAMNEFRATITDRNNSYVTKTELGLWKEKVESDLQVLRDFRLVMDTKASSKSIMIAYIITGISLFISVVSFIFMLIDRI